MDNRSRGGKGGGNRSRSGTPGRDGAPADPKANPNSTEPALMQGAVATERREESGFTEKVIQIRRVTKVVKGGKKLSFRAVVVVGNESGQVGIGIGKSHEVVGAIQKGVAEAMKNLVTVPLHKGTIPHPVEVEFSSARVLLRPASEGTGVIAGGAARSVLELAGVKNVLSKAMGSNSPLNVAQAALKALSELRTFKEIARNRGLSVAEMLN